MAKKNKKIEEKDSESVLSGVAGKFKQNPVLYTGSILILVLVIVTFLGGDLLAGGTGSNADLTFGYYDKAPVSWVPGNIFAKYREQVTQYYQSLGRDVNNMWTTVEIWRQAYELTVRHTAILQIMKRSNYSIPESIVNREVAQLPDFQENGRFSTVLYNQMSESNRLALWRQVQEEMTKLAYFNDLYGLLIPSSESAFIGNMASVMRSFEMVSFNVDNYPEAEYLAYARANSDLFRTIHLSKITVNSSERDARKILDSIKNGSITFEDAARAQSQDTFANTGGDMGVRYVYELEGEIPNPSGRDIIFGLRKGETSDVIRIGDSWAFFRVEDELKSTDFEEDSFTNDSAMDRVRSYLRNFDRGRMEDWAIAQAKDFIADAQVSGFDNAASWRSLEKRSFGPLPINYGDVELFTDLKSFTISGLTAQDIQGLSNNENFWKIAFSTRLNTPCEPLVQGSYVLVFLPVEEVKAEQTAVDDIMLMYPSYLNYVTEQFLSNYFLNNSRMDDRFWDTYFRFFMQ
ncbi:MAG: SurA N-terminal domain-containing protein [Treponema sp.]|jgi:hypothetical protein|nr:SurA N-terminal domain-containing protein [Treponema sp.]